MPMMAAPAKVPYIRSLIRILPWPSADMANEVTTLAEMAQYALIMPLFAKNGAVLTIVVGPTTGTSKKMHG